MTSILKSVSSKFTIVAITIISLLIIVAGIIEFNAVKSQWQKSWEDSFTGTISIVELAMPNALWNFQESSIQDFLVAAVSTSYIKAAFVEENGEITWGMHETFSGDINPSTETDLYTETVRTDLFFDDAGSDPIATLIVATDDTSLTEALSKVIQLTVARLVLLDLALALILYLITRSIVLNPVNQISFALKDISEGEGDLTQRIETKTEDEIGSMGVYFNNFVDKLQVSMQQISDVSHQVTDLNNGLGNLSDKTQKLVVRQDEEIEQVAAAITEMSSSFNDVAENTKMSSTAAEEAKVAVHQAREQVGQAVVIIQELSSQIDESSEAMSSLSSEVESIVTVLNVIRGIAEQTNLLALNAAIEAARAGEQGRGFAVVADEVRALAARTQDSTSEIQSMIEKLEQGTARGVHTIEQGRDSGNKSVSRITEVDASLQIVYDSVNQISDMAQQISSSVQEQNQVNDEIAQNVNQVAMLANETADCARDSNIKGKDVADQVDRLSTLISSFKI